MNMSFVSFEMKFCMRYEFEINVAEDEAAHHNWLFCCALWFWLEVNINKAFSLWNHTYFSISEYDCGEAPYVILISMPPETRDACAL